MDGVVLLVGELDDFVRLVDRNEYVACWWKMDFNGYSGTIYIYAEAKSNEGGYIAYREVRRLDPTILNNLEKAHGVEFGDGDLAERYFSMACYLYDRFLEKLRMRGLRVMKGRYFYAHSIKPLIE